MKDIAIDYRVDERNQVVIATAHMFIPHSDLSGEFKQIAKAKARCVPGDKWDVNYGKELARTRLLLKLNKIEIKVVTCAIKEIQEQLKEACADMDRLNTDKVRLQARLVKLLGEDNNDD